MDRAPEHSVVPQNPEDNSDSAELSGMTLLEMYLGGQAVKRARQAEFERTTYISQRTVLPH